MWQRKIHYLEKYDLKIILLNPTIVHRQWFWINKFSFPFIAKCRYGLVAAHFHLAVLHCKSQHQYHCFQFLQDFFPSPASITSKPNLFYFLNGYVDYKRPYKFTWLMHFLLQEQKIIWITSRYILIQKIKIMVCFMIVQSC